MNSIGARLTISYALTATATLAILFLAGYQLLESRLIHGLDELNEAEFHQLEARLGPDYRNLTAEVLDERVRATSEYSSVLFYISIENPKSNKVRFNSRNLQGRSIPDIPGKRAYSTVMPGVGGIRVDEYLLPPFDVTIATSSRAVADGMREYVKVCLALLAAMLLASIGIGLWLTRMLLKPVRLIGETALRIGSNNLSERIPVAEVEDEISGLARLLNQTFDRLERAFDQIRRFSDEASHELKTPLSLIRLHAEQMLTDGDLSPSHAEAVVVQIEEVARLNQIIDELLFLSRAEAKAVALQQRLQDPARLIESFAQDAQALAEHGGRRFEHSHSGSGRVTVDEKWIRQVLLNVLTNALNASPAGGVVSMISTVDAERWRVAIEDSGPGLNPEQRERIFDRFVRFNPPVGEDRGSGLGLTISQSIIGLHQGRIFAEPRAGASGLRVVFEVPAAIARDRRAHAA